MSLVAVYNALKEAKVSDATAAAVDALEISQERYSELRADMAKMEGSLNERMMALQADTNARIAELRADMDKRIARVEIAIWIIGVMILPLLGKAFFF